jgi:hypothetical protein
MPTGLWFRCQGGSEYECFSLDECKVRIPVVPRVRVWRRVDKGDPDYPDERARRSPDWRVDPDGPDGPDLKRAAFQRLPATMKGVDGENVDCTMEDPDQSHWREYVLTAKGCWVQCWPEPRTDARMVGVAKSEVIRDVEENKIRLSPEQIEALRIRPRWDEAGPRYRLWYGETICLEYRRSAGPQFAILRAFQGADWAESIGRPTGVGGRPLDDTQIKNAVHNIQVKLDAKKAPIWIEGRSRLRWHPR